MNKSAFWLLAGVSMVAFASPALAQEAEETGEIVVTAQNRSQNVQDVPIAMNVLDAERLEESGVNDLNSLTRLAPDVSVTNDTVFTRVAIRGIGTNSNEEAQDQSLTINIDGEYINRPLALNASMFDLERIEVLRGPQGTLYGRNATGGAINIITRHPELGEFGGNLSLAGGNYNSFNFDGALNVPIGDRAAVRVALMSAQHDGYSYHPNLDLRSDDQDVVAARAGLQFNPTDALSIYLAAEHIEVDQTSVPYAYVNNNTAGFRADEGSPGVCSNGWVEVAPLIAGSQCSPDHTNYLQDIDRHDFNAAFVPGRGVGLFDSTQTAYRGEVNYDLGSVTFTYRTGYRETETARVTTLPPSYAFIGPVQDTQTWSNEFRLSGGQDGGILWQGGIFLFNEDQQNSAGLYQPFIGPNGSYINYFYRDLEAESRAAFGQVEFPITQQLTAVVGGRYTEDEKAGHYINYGFSFNSGPNPVTGGAPTLLDLSADAQETTWSLGLNYEPSDDTLIYGRVSTGFKSGGFDNVGSYDPETISAYEFGTKNEFADGRFVANAAAFYYDYSDLQVSVLINSVVGNQVFNAGQATIWGLEGQFDAFLTDNDRLSLTVNYLNASYDEFLASIPVQDLGGGANAVGDLDGVPGDPVVQPDLAGNTPVQSPEWVITLGYDHVWNLEDGTAITASIFSRYKSDYYTSVFNYDDSLQEAYVQTDASLQLEPAGGIFRLQAYVRNLEDERPLTYAQFVSAGPDDIFNWAFGAPRTYGLRVAMNF